jgi:hypothetical protein
MNFECTKKSGAILIEGLDLAIAIHARRVIEKEFDALVDLTVSTDDHTVLLVRGAGGEPLDDSETAEMYYMWVRGWIVGRQEALKRHRKKNCKCTSK